MKLEGKSDPPNKDGLVQVNFYSHDIGTVNLIVTIWTTKNDKNTTWGSYGFQEGMNDAVHINISTLVRFDTATWVQCNEASVTTI